MKDIKLAYLSLFLISTTVICFEIISTRISSVIFVNNYAFIILSFAILGLGIGGIYSYYNRDKGNYKSKSFIFKILLVTAISLIVFIVAIIKLKITNPFIYFLLIFFPFFFAGIIYARIFSTYVENSFRLYASDLAGAAIGSIASIFIFNIFNAPNTILLLAILILILTGIYIPWNIKKKQIIVLYSVLTFLLLILTFNGKDNFLGNIPIGNYPEKDYYHVYPNATNISEIVDSDWSIYGRTDLVQYSNQDMVKQLFIDGSAGSQMYRFNGNIRTPDQLLYNMLISQSNSIPFFFLKENEKNNMLIIGPGGGKEVLIGLLSRVNRITGVEINPDFVKNVKKYKDFNGGIYTNFPNVQILVNEGRHYVKKTPYHFDIIIMALPSTEQLQSIDNYAMNENYLLTVEALKDYLNILTPEGSLIFTVHNRWELMRLIITTMEAFKNLGITPINALNHFMIIEQDYAPTVVIKKNAFTKDEIARTLEISKNIPKDFPSVTYLPFIWNKLNNSGINNFLLGLKNHSVSTQKFIQKNKYNLEPCYDDSPYFYKINKGVPQNFIWLLIVLLAINIGILFILYNFAIKKQNPIEKKTMNLSLFIFSCIGMGFMTIEISLFQKLILYLGSPTISLSILLSSILVGMGIGSYFSKNLLGDQLIKKILLACVIITSYGIILFLILPEILNNLLAYSLIFRAIVSMIVIIPFGIFLGVPFPTALQVLNKAELKNYIPWMYGINGTMTVLGSVLAVIISMTTGFTMSFFIGLSFYFIILILTVLFKSKIKIV